MRQRPFAVLALSVALALVAVSFAAAVAGPRDRVIPVSVWSAPRAGRGSEAAETRDQTAWEYDTWNHFHDWFVDELPEAILDSARVRIEDADGIATASLRASSNHGWTWQSYPLVPEGGGSDWYVAPPPVDQMSGGTEIWYYFTATDGLGNPSRFPATAPGQVLEFSILPIVGSEETPGILLVDKHEGLTPGEDGDYQHDSEYYYREALGALGYEWDTYDVNVPGATLSHSAGPDSSGMKYYDTQVWFTSDVDTRTLTPDDQLALVMWLNESTYGKTRNLLLTGNDIGYDLVQVGWETLGLYDIWLASEYIQDSVGDSVPVLRDYAGGFDFMTHADGECVLRGGAPSPCAFDVVEPQAGVALTETAVEYVRSDLQQSSAGAAYDHPVLDYETVNLGFGMEFMMGDRLPDGTYTSGTADRQDLMSNIMAFFGKEPSAGPEPEIVGIVDVGNDQGRQVRIRWERSFHDAPGCTTCVTGYAIYRRQDQWMREPAHGAAEIRRRSVEEAEGIPPADAASRFGVWDYVTTVPSTGSMLYQCVAPTLCDSTAEAGICWSVFGIRALTDVAWVYFDSPPDSGYSIDNLAPGVPGGFLVDYSRYQNQLSWEESQDEDFDYFRVYRGTDPDFVPRPENLVHSTTGTEWTDLVDEGWLYYYLITATDFGGNESDPAWPVRTGVETGGTPEGFVLHQNVPNPLHPTTRISYEVPAPGGRVALRIYDPAGRVVRAMLDTWAPPGRYVVEWDGRDARGAEVAAGVYFYVLEAPGFSERRKMTVVK